MRFLATNSGDFDRRVRDAGVEPEYVVEIKIDGLSCSLGIRKRRTLVRASTRGDGVCRRGRHGKCAKPSEAFPNS